MNRMFILSTSGTKPKTIHAVESKQNRKQSRALAKRTTAETKLIRRLTQRNSGGWLGGQQQRSTLDGKDVAYLETWPEITDGWRGWTPLVAWPGSGGDMGGDGTLLETWTEAATATETLCWQGRKPALTDGVWHPSPCQADMSRWLDRTTATVKIMEPLRQVDTASEASDRAGVPPFVQGRMSATACMEETLWNPAVTVMGHRSSSTGGRPPQRGVTGSGFGSDRAGLNTAGWAGPCGSDSTGLGRSGSDIDRSGLAWRDKCYRGIYSEANSHEPKHVHVQLWEM